MVHRVRPISGVVRGKLRRLSVSPLRVRSA
jgi:hypothetical protein